jgi:hypothetical protein
VALDDDDHTARVQSLREPTKINSNDDAAASKDATTTTTTAQSQTPRHIEEPHPQHIELGLFGRCDDRTYVPLPMVSDHSATGPTHSANRAGGSLLTSLRSVTGTVTNTASTNPTISKASCIAVRTLTNEPAPMDCQFQWFKNTQLFWDSDTASLVWYRNMPFAPCRSSVAIISSTSSNGALLLTLPIPLD